MAQKEVSHKKAAVLGLQHLLAMYSGAVAVPLLIGTALHFNSTQMTYLVSIDIFMCGLATLIQLFRNKYFGIGLPVVLGCAIQAVAPLEMIGQKFSINTDVWCYYRCWNLRLSNCWLVFKNQKTLPASSYWDLNYSNWANFNSGRFPKYGRRKRTSQRLR